MKEDVTRETRKYLEMKGNSITSIPKPMGTVTALLRGKFVTLDGLFKNKRDSKSTTQLYSFRN